MAEPARRSWWTKGGESPGWYFAVTTGSHVGYESWLERDRLTLLDRDPEVLGIASQPFWLHWHEGQEQRRHAPDYFVRLSDGRARVVDVRSADWTSGPERHSRQLAVPARPRAGSSSGAAWGRVLVLPVGGDPL